MARLEDYRPIVGSDTLEERALLPPAEIKQIADGLNDFAYDYLLGVITDYLTLRRSFSEWLDPLETK